MRHVEEYNDEMPAQDSFLDVITNIVGILILLVVIAGLRTSRAVEDASNVQIAGATVSSISEEELLEARNSAAGAARDVEQMVRRAINIRQETQMREQERMILNTMVAGAEQEIAARRAELDVQSQRDFDCRRKLVEAQSTLDELTRQQMALLAEEPESENIECRPTPLGKAVDGNEVCIQLCDDYVAVLPVDELAKEFKDDAEQNIWRLKQEDEMVRTVGPINGFHMRYYIEKFDVVARTGSGAVTSMGGVPKLSHCVFLPVTKPIGEPFREAMGPNSELRQYLKQHAPGKTTVVLFTYPGNYAQLRELKRSLQDQGYQTAPVALANDQPISVGPGGRRVLAE